MAGYCGYSKSNNAVQAERNNKFPKSKWTKELILKVLSEEVEENDEKFQFLANKPAAFLKDFLLVSYEWHHTSSYYNCTEYYEVRDLYSWTLSEIQEQFEIYQAAKRAEKQEKAARKEETSIYECEFLVWSGTRKHPKAETIRETGEIKGNWFYSSYGKKLITANGFKILREVK